MKITALVLTFLTFSTVLGGLFYHVGFFGETPVVGLRFLFPVDLGEIKALANLDVRVSVSGMNLLFDQLERGKPVKMVLVDLGDVGVSYGCLRSPLPFGSWNPNPEDWIFRVGNSWIGFSNEMSLWSYTGVLGVYLSRSRWRVIYRPLEWLGIGYDNLQGATLALKYGDIEMDLEERGLKMSIVADGFTFLFSTEDGFNLSLGYVNGEEYLILRKDGFEFAKKVGSVYVSGGFHEKTPTFSIEYPIRF